MDIKELEIWLEQHHQDNDFLTSLWNQLKERGFLSDKQLDCIERTIKKSQPKQFSLKSGDKITIKKWLAHNLKDQINITKDPTKNYFFRNLIIEEVLHESEKAYLVRVRFDSDIRNCCHICGRDLDNPVSMATGVGPICAEQLGIKRYSLEDAPKVLEEIEKICKAVGIIGPIWLPKSQLEKRKQE